MPAHLGEHTWPELANGMAPLLAVPIGSCEQHGPHLPLDTDTRIASALAAELIAAFEPGRILIAPPIAVSASGEHAGFPGTLSIGTDVMATLLIELARSADWAAGIVLVNGHGGNAEPVRRAVATLTSEGRNVLAWWPRLRGADAHAGMTETSLMLTIAPELVRMDDAAAGRTEPIADLIDELRHSGVKPVSPNGVLGDPMGATADHGRAVLGHLVADLVAVVDTWWIR
jgi:creatinine amidohydrolase